jgi:hypothetical protein
MYLVGPRPTLENLNQDETPFTAALNLSPLASHHPMPRAQLLPLWLFSIHKSRRPVEEDAGVSFAAVRSGLRSKRSWTQFRPSDFLEFGMSRAAAIGARRRRHVTAPSLFVMYADGQTRTIRTSAKRSLGRPVFEVSLPNKSAGGAQVQAAAVIDPESKRATVVHSGPLDCSDCGHKCECQDMVLNIPLSVVMQLRRPPAPTTQRPDDSAQPTNAADDPDDALVIDLTNEP